MKLSLQPTTKKFPQEKYVRVTFDTTTDLTQDQLRDGIRTLVLGLEETAPLDRRKTITLVRRIISEAKARRTTRLSLALADLVALVPADLDVAALLRLFGENALMANYAFTEFKAKPKKGWGNVEEIILIGDVTAAEKASLKLGEIVGEEVNKCRDLSNMPGGDMTPSILAKETKKAASGTGASVTVLGKKELEKHKMGAILGVAKGSKEEPKFIIVEYQGGKKGTAPVVLVGKGITFDTGGLNLKPSNSISDMHLDMSGGAAVVHAVLAAARLKLPVNAVALVPAAENMPSGESYRPGDILRTMSGKTIEVVDTDAEGRIVLSDALTYAAKYKPAAVVDVATLTGAAMVALGTKASAVMTKDASFSEQLRTLGELSGDYVWPLPLWDEYKDRIKGKFGDVANLPQSEARLGGSIDGGMFLAEFAQGYPEGTPWAHLDIAPRMTSDKSDLLAPGAAGTPVRLLVRLLEHYAK